MNRIGISLAALLVFININAQPADKNQDTESIDTSNNYILSYLGYSDISFLWTGDISQDERLGFIGDDFERFHIHFNSIIQNFDNPFEYLVYGKSMVKSNICEFQGSLIIYEVGFDLENEDGSGSGYIKGDYLFYEDPSCLHSGIFQGEFYTNFYIDKTETLYYDDLSANDNSFTNNSFEGKWYDYNSELEQFCNWGDKRIPGSSPLDIGLTKFKPSFKYYDSGWASYAEEKEKNSQNPAPWWK